MRCSSPVLSADTAKLGQTKTRRTRFNSELPSETWWYLNLGISPKSKRGRGEFAAHRARGEPANVQKNHAAIQATYMIPVVSGTATRRDESFPQVLPFSQAELPQFHSAGRRMVHGRPCRLNPTGYLRVGFSITRVARTLRPIRADALICINGPIAQWHQSERGNAG